VEVCGSMWCVVFCSVLCCVLFGSPGAGSLDNPDLGGSITAATQVGGHIYIYPASPLPGYPHDDVAPRPISAAAAGRRQLAGPILKAAVQNLTEHFKYSGCLRNSGGIEDVGPGQEKEKGARMDSPTPPLPFSNAKTEKEKMPSSIHPSIPPSFSP
jgi:hypothetical protein